MQSTVLAAAQGAVGNGGPQAGGENSCVLGVTVRDAVSIPNLEFILHPSQVSEREGAGL